MTEKEIEKLFKSKLGNREFDFNPANWEAMETMLDSEPKPAGAFYWRSVMAVLLFGIAVWSFITFSSTVDEVQVVNNSEVTEPTESTNQEKGSSSEVGTTANDKQEEEPIVQSETAEETELIKSIAIKPTLPIQQNQMSNVATTEPIESSETPVTGYIDEVTQNALALVEPIPTMPLSSKGFVFQYEMPQSLANVSGGEYFTPEAFRKFDSKSSFYVEIAPIFSGSYNANNVGVGWKAGLGWERSMGEKFQFNVGLGYTVQNGVGIENNSDSVFFNFGREVIETQETNNRLDYIELPVSMGYKLNEKNMLQLGIYTSYLVNVSREIEKEISQFKTETRYESQKKSGYQKEFRRMDFGLDLGYQYRLTPVLSVGLHYNLGLVDITKNTQGEYTQRHTNQNTRVVFRYRFL